VLTSLNNEIMYSKTLLLWSCVDVCMSKSIGEWNFTFLLIRNDVGGHLLSVASTRYSTEEEVVETI
jgi:hypothetical protein